MKKLFLFFILLVSLSVSGQNQVLQEYQRADSLIINNEVQLGLHKLVQLEQQLTRSDPMYDDVLIYIVKIMSYYESSMRGNQQYDLAISYGNQALDYIKKGSLKFYDEYHAREAIMRQDLTVSYNILQQYDSAEEHIAWLYKNYNAHNLPTELESCFNFDFIKLDSLNIWGYEWFEPMPKDKHNRSFSKIVYYVYSTMPDGRDKEQLYRFHVLMYHGQELDYVLDKRIEAAKNEKGGIYYNYHYSADIDRRQVHNDIIRIIKTKQAPDQPI